MRRPSYMLLVTVLGGLSARAGAGPTGAPAPQPVRPRCTPAAIADVHLPFAMPVDEIHVVVAATSPIAGAAEVTVDSGGFDRVLHVRGSSHGLKFHPALTSNQFRISLDPVFTAGSPCVERIELRRAGAAVATVVP